MGRLLGVTVVSVAQNKLQLRLLTAVASEFVVPMCEYCGLRVCSQGCCSHDWPRLAGATCLSPASSNQLYFFASSVATALQHKYMVCHLLPCAAAASIRASPEDGPDAIVKPIATATSEHMLELRLDPESRALAGADLQPADADISGVVHEAVEHQRGLDFVVRAALELWPAIISREHPLGVCPPQSMSCFVLCYRCGKSVHCWLSASGDMRSLKVCSCSLAVFIMCCMAFSSDHVFPATMQKHPKRFLS